MDVVTVPSTSMIGMAIDPTVLDPASRECLELWSNHADAECPLKAAEGTKREHYADLSAAWKLFPCGHGTQGDMGPGAHECTKELACLIATRRNGGTPPSSAFVGAMRREVYGRLGLALMRELAEQIISSFANSPRAGLTAENAHVHSNFRPGRAGTPLSPCSCDPDHVGRFGCACNSAAPRAWAPRRRAARA
jgi:hypothetical protein